MAVLKIVLMEPFASRIPPDRHPAFLADLWAHNARYAAGFVGGIVLIIRVWRSRARGVELDR